jgi:hypothetical protein
MTQSIQTPPGYKKLEALNKTAHRFALPKETSFAFSAQLNALPLTLSEFPVACHHYPVVFSSPDGIGDFSAIAVTGLKSGHSLFCGTDGKWRAGVYIPAYARCYPFCLATVIEDGKTRPNKLVCIAAEAVVSDGVELFTESGDYTPAWREREKLLQEYENDVAKTAEMCKALKGMGLFKEFAIQATTANKELFNLAGMYRVDEAALSKLSAYQFRKLIAQGWMEKIYAHLISLRNFQSLVDIYGAAS